MPSITANERLALIAIVSSVAAAIAITVGVRSCGEDKQDPKPLADVVASEEAAQVERVVIVHEERRAKLQAAASEPDARKRTLEVHKQLVGFIPLILATALFSPSAHAGIFPSEPWQALPPDPVELPPPSQSDCPEVPLLAESPVELACYGHVITTARAVSLLDSRAQAQFYRSQYEISFAGRLADRAIAEAAVADLQGDLKVAKRNAFKSAVYGVGIGLAIGAATTIAVGVSIQ